MAEYFFRKQLEEHGEKSRLWSVSSAGTWTENGIPPDDKLIEVMKEFDIDIHDHRSKKLEDVDIYKQNLILVMEHNQREALQFEFPRKKNQIYLLSQMIGNDFNIDDPCGRHINEYRRVAHRINQILSQGYLNILNLSMKNESTSSY